MKILDNNFGKINLYIRYAIFLGCVWITHLVIISIVAFFHFQMEHGLSVIEEWIYLNGWGITALAKVSGLVVLWKTLLYAEEKQRFIQYIQNSIIAPSRDVLIVLCFNVLFFIMNGGIKFNTVDLGVSEFLVALISIFLFYFVDVLYINFLLQDQKTTRLERNLYLIIFSIMYFSASKLTFVYEKGIGLFVIFAFFMTVLLSVWPLKNVINGLVFLICFITPFSLLTQYNPIWGNSFPKIIILNGFTFSTYVCAAIISIVYLVYKKYGKDKILRNLKLRFDSLSRRNSNGK